MPWTTPTLKTLRQNARAYIMSALEGADALIPNSVLRVVADVNAGLTHLVLQFIAWLANQLLPAGLPGQSGSTDVWLDRWATMYLVNSDGSRGRKQASFAVGTAAFVTTGLTGGTIDAGTILTCGNGVNYQVTEQASASGQNMTVNVSVAALTAGAIGNLDPGTGIGFTTPPNGFGFAGQIVTLTGGADTESDDQLRYRLLIRLSNPPMGGDASDYVLWALAVPGVTRAWASPMEMGVGTMTIRFMCDSLRAANGGLPTSEDITAVTNYINSVRPVTVKDLFVVAPVPSPIDFMVSNLVNDETTTWDNIQTSVNAMILAKAAPAYAVNGIAQPAQTIYAVWVSDAIMNAAGVDHFDLYDVNGNPLGDFVMPNLGSIAVMGNIIHG